MEISAACSEDGVEEAKPDFGTKELSDLSRGSGVDAFLLPLTKIE